MNTTDDTPAHYGKMPPLAERRKKKLYTEHKSYMDGEDATMALTTGTMAQREQWVDSLPYVVCYEGFEGMQKAFDEWLTEHRKKK